MTNKIKQAMAESEKEFIKNFFIEDGDIPVKLFVEMECFILEQNKALLRAVVKEVDGMIERDCDPYCHENQGCDCNSCYPFKNVKQILEETITQ